MFQYLIRSIHIHTADGYGRSANSPRRLFQLDFHPDALLAEEVQLEASHLFKLIFEDLPGDIVFESPTEAVGQSFTKGLALLLVVRDVDAEAPTLQESISLELLKECP